MILGLVDEAVCCGARLGPACQTLGLTARTVQLWQEQGGGDRRHGPKSAPPNKLSRVERRRVLEIVNSPECCGLSPNQIVPRLADEGTYVASEATIYRILREEDVLASSPALATGRHRAPRSVSPSS